MVGYSLPPTAAPADKPAWLNGLLTAKFFTACAAHSAAKKNERNICCVDCDGDGICPHCAPCHRGHRLIQVRRYVYHDVVRLSDVSMLMDIAGVQTYIINSARVVFLNQRPQLRPSKGQGNVCETCERSLQESFSYCSVGCKVDAVLKKPNGLKALMPLRKDAREMVKELGLFKSAPPKVLGSSKSSSTSGKATHTTTKREKASSPTSHFDTLPVMKRVKVDADSSRKSNMSDGVTRLSLSETMSFDNDKSSPAVEEIDAPLSVHSSPSVAPPISPSAFSPPTTPLSTRQSQDSASSKSESQFSISCGHHIFRGIPNRRKGVPQRSPVF